MHVHQQPESDNRRRLLIGLGAALAVAAAILIALLIADDDDDPVVADDSTTTEVTTTTEATTTTAPETTTTQGFAVVDPTATVYPDPGTSQRFDDPVALVDSFARGPLGFSAPVVGELQSGDARSGEVEVRAFDEGSPTVVLVRQLEDDTWFVIGSETESIQLASPAAGDAISSPQPLSGQAYAFEGTVVVRLYGSDLTTPLAETVVTGRGDGQLGDFTGELTFTAPSDTEYGSLFLLSPSGEDGGTIAAQVLRVEL